MVQIRSFSMQHTLKCALLYIGSQSRRVTRQSKVLLGAISYAFGTVAYDRPVLCSCDLHQLGASSRSALLSFLNLAQRQPLQRSLCAWIIAYDQPILCSWNWHQMGASSGSVLLCLHLAERQKLQRCNSLRLWIIAYDQSVLCSWDLYQTGGSTGSAVVLFRRLAAMPWAAVLFVGVVGTGE